jgi:hypothetical protein
MRILVTVPPLVTLTSGMPAAEANSQAASRLANPPAGPPAQ